MAIPLDKKLYESVKKKVNKMYKKHSAYRSGMYVKMYKQMGGRYKNLRSSTTIDDFPLKRWFLEKWKDVNPKKSKRSYPVYRPTVRVSKRTPRTLKEISKRKLAKQSKLKQRIKGKKNLPKF
jgi:hypothetical protein